MPPAPLAIEEGTDVIVAVGHPAPRLDEGFERVAWTRGEGCLSVATQLSRAPAVRVEDDLLHCCVTERIDLLVTRRLSSFDLVPVVVPHRVDLEDVVAVTAAVGDGPHSHLAAAVASRFGEALGVPAELVTAYRGPEDIPVALARLVRLAGPHSNLGQRTVNEPTATRLVDSLIPGTLLVVGAPGGSWLQRQLFGTGHRLLVTAPSGALVVRSAPRRCYQDAADATGVALGRHLTVKEALRLMTYPVVPVADDGLLVGIVRVATLAEVDPALPIGAVMEPPVAVVATEPTTAADELREFFGHSPIPVVNAVGVLIGTISSTPPSGHLAHREATPR